MSDTGMYSTRYEQLRDFAELLDEVLIDLNTRTSSPENPQRRKLAEMLLGAADRATLNMDTVHLAALLRANGQKSLEQWAQVGRELLTTEPATGAIKKLEALAFRLDERLTEAAAKMRGAVSSG